MPILDIQRRFRELGRIRLGVKEPVLTQGGKPKTKDGQPVTRPKKLSTFRLTTPWRHLLDAALEVGIAGEVKPWTPEEGREEFELVTDVNRLDVLVPPGEVLSQWWEAWKGGGCDRRCDGVRMVIAGGKSADRDCLCAKENRDPRACKPTTRLLVMLPGLPDLGVWRLESHGFNAAVELGGAVNITELATARGVIIPAELRIEKRSVKRPGEPVKRFAVPVLGFRTRLGDTLSALGFGDPSGMALMGGAGAVEVRPALTTGGTPELSEGNPEGAREANAKPDPRAVEEATLPPAAGGAATEAKPTGTPAATDDEEDTGDDIEDAELVDTPAAFEPPAHDPQAEAEGSGGSTLSTAQFVAIRARENGIDDDTRHAIIGVVTRGRTRSGKDLTVGKEVTRVVKLFESIKAGDVTVTHDDAGAWTFKDEKGNVLVLNADDTIGNPALGEHADERGHLKPPAAKP